MKPELLKNIPLGIFLLCVFYAVNVFLFLVTAIVFYKILDVTMLGFVLHAPYDLTIRLLLILIPLYLIFGFLYPRKEAFIVAIVYHLFFALNGFLTALRLVTFRYSIKPFLEISLKPEFSVSRALDIARIPYEAYLIQFPSAVIGTIIIVYLFKILIKKPEYSY